MFQRSSGTCPRGSVDRWHRDGHRARLLRLPDIPFRTHCGVQFCLCSQCLVIHLRDRFQWLKKTTVRVSPVSLSLSYSFFLSFFLSFSLPSHPLLSSLCTLLPCIPLIRQREKSERRGRSGDEKERRYDSGENREGPVSCMRCAVKCLCDCSMALCTWWRRRGTNAMAVRPRNALQRDTTAPGPHFSWLFFVDTP